MPEESAGETVIQRISRFFDTLYLTLKVMRLQAMSSGNRSKQSELFRFLVRLPGVGQAVCA